MKIVRMLFRNLLWIITVCWLTGCSNKHTGFSWLNSSATGIDFANNITETKDFNVGTFEYIYNGAGVAVGDVNNDGLPDIFFSGNQVSSRLYINEGNMHFKDITAEAGVATTLWCTGVSMVDINADGLLDIYVCTVDPMGSTPSPNLFFINQGLDKNGTPHYKEMALALHLADTSYSTQAAFLDYDNDGDLDMYLLNNGNVDYDRNQLRTIKTDGSAINNDKLFRNDGINPETHLPQFTNVSKEAGITKEGWGLGITITDINKDGWPDIAVSNDFMSNDLLWINCRNGTFKDSIHNCMKHESENSMGIDAADINNDALTDIATVDMKPFTNERDKSMLGRQLYDKFYLGLEHGYEPQFMRNMLQVNNGVDESGKPGISFSERGQQAGMYATDWSWSVLFADFDNDGYKDLYISDGYGKDITDLDYISYSTDPATNMFGTAATKSEAWYKRIQQQPEVKLPGFLFHNNQDGTFADVSKEQGFTHPAITNGVAYADLDNDGDLDLVCNTLNSPACIYQNSAANNKKDSASHHFIDVKFRGEGSNTYGIGSKVLVWCKGSPQYAEMFVNHGYKSTSTFNLHFGLAKNKTVDSLMVQWPSGKTQTLHNCKADTLLTLDEHNAGTAPVSFNVIQQQRLFHPISDKDCGIDYVHRENGFIDFNSQALLPYQYSKCGPGEAVGDLNGDGLDDVFFGSALGDTSYIFYQGKNGSFTKTIFEAGNKHEDMGALIFDADGDGDNDLFIVSGGNEAPANFPQYQDRLYRNDGDKKFHADSNALPSTIAASGGSVIGADIDNDGDIDLFVCGKVSPKNYPLPAQSFLLRNDNGKFTDVTDKLAPGLKNIGMVTSALFSDINNDGYADLVLAGEWMPVTTFINTKSGYKNITASTGLGNEKGMWNSIVSGDFDNDGDMDFVVGNEGNNTRYKASDNEPVRIYAKDFNDDTRIDPVMSYYLNGKEVSAAYRDELIDQMIGMRRRFPFYALFGKADFDQVITPAERKGAYQNECNTSNSCFIENKGNGKFAMRALPNAVQSFPVYGMKTGYFNGDDNLDVILIGNNYNTSVLAGWQDAGTGLILCGDGKGNFTPLTSLQSGFYNSNDGKALALLMCNNKPLYIATNNNSAAKVFALSKAVTYLSVSKDVAYATIVLHNGKKIKQDINYGSGYCSQSSRVVELPDGCQTVFITDYKGNTEKIK